MAKSKKRGNGEGCIFKNKNGRYEARITKGYNAAGKQQFKYFSAKTQKEVLKKLDNYKAELEKGTYAQPCKLTVGEWLDSWYENHVINKVSLATRVADEQTIASHLKPRFGHIKLKDLKGHQVQQVYNELLVSGRIDGKGGLSAKSVKNIHIILHRALEQAVKDNIIIKNPLKGVTLPRLIRKKIEILSPDEQKCLIEKCSDHNWGTAIILTLYTGLRMGECLGLTWEDVNFEKNTVSINKQVSRLKDYNTNARTKTKIFVREETKTSSSRRTIYIAPVIMDKLKLYKQKQDLERTFWGKAYNNLNMVFCRTDGNFIDPSTFRKHYQKTLNKAGISKKTFHALRHTFATRALESGVSVKVVSEILGHASVQITLDTYSHVSFDLQQDAMQRIAENFL